MVILPYKYEEYKGFIMSQREGVYNVFKSFIDKEYFDVIIEIGTWFGGFAYMLSDMFGSRFHTYDVKDNTIGNVRDKILLNKSSIYIENVFKSDSILKLIESGGRLLLLCDGGDKSEEIRFFSPFLKSGDVVMAHDFFPSKEEHDPNHWRSCEVTSDDFNYSYLKEYKDYTEVFKPYVWGIRVKV